MFLSSCADSINVKHIPFSAHRPQKRPTCPFPGTRLVLLSARYLVFFPAFPRVCSLCCPLSYLSSCLLALFSSCPLVVLPARYFIRFPTCPLVCSLFFLFATSLHVCSLFCLIFVSCRFDRLFFCLLFHGCTCKRCPFSLHLFSPSCPCMHHP